MCAAPEVDKDAPFSMLATILEADPYLGRILTGRVYCGARQSRHADQSA